MISELLALEKINNVDGSYLMRYKYPVLDTELSVDEWWDSLNNNERFDVATAAIHYYLFTPNYIWWTHTNFRETKKPQQKHIKYVYDKRNEPYRMFPTTELIMKNI